MGEDKEWRPIGSNRFGFTPLPKRAQHRQSWPSQQVTSPHPPYHVQVDGSRMGGVRNQFHAGFTVPLQAAFGFQVGTITDQLMA